MITINATGDTTLHTAGKYCPEDILVKVPAGGSGSGVELPELSNPGSAADLLSGKELIDADGNIVTGTITTQAAKTITPSESSQTAVAKGVYTTGAVTVAAIPSDYVKLAGSAYITENGYHDVSTNEYAIVEVSPPVCEVTVTSYAKCLIYYTYVDSGECITDMMILPAESTICISGVLRGSSMVITSDTKYNYVVHMTCDNMSVNYSTNYTVQLYVSCDDNESDCSVTIT